MSKEEIVAFLNDMIDALSWKRFLLLTLCSIVTVALIILFESRASIVNRLIQETPVEERTAPWEISAESKGALTELTKQSFIAAVMLTEVNLKKNRRIVKFWYAKDPVFRQEAQMVVASMLPQAFFDVDKKNNEQMLAVLNNQFICNSTQDTVFIRFIPDIQKKYPTVCRLAVPPFTGEFAGLVTLLLSRAPTPAEADGIKIQLTQISIELYLRDIQRKDRG